MIPVLTPAEMAEVDREAPEPVDELVRRAAGAVRRRALGMLGQAYGRRVVVVAGPGNNGWDGRVAAAQLSGLGVRTKVFDATDCPSELPPADLVVDAAFGTGFRGRYEFPDTVGAPVLAVDIPSAVNGLTGVVQGAAAHASATVTFAALKPGLLLGEGPARCGQLHVADIGLDVSRASMHLVTDDDLTVWIPGRAADAHKWSHAVWLIAGSPEMPGAARLASAAALRGGAGYVRLSSPGVDRPEAPVEAVHCPLDPSDWVTEVLADSARFAAVALGPGLGRGETTVTAVRDLVENLARPLVVDGDALFALGDDAAEIISGRSAPTVLTPHDGEFQLLTGTGPGPDRLDAVRSLAAASRCVVLLKGSTTLVADASGEVLFVRSGDRRLATAGTGDVLTGLIAAHLAMGAAPLHAAAAGAHIHGLAAHLGPTNGLVASDLVDLIPVAWAELEDRRERVPPGA